MTFMFFCSLLRYGRGVYWGAIEQFLTPFLGDGGGNDRFDNIVGLALVGKVHKSLLF